MIIKWLPSRINHNKLKPIIIFLTLDLQLKIKFILHRSCNYFNFKFLCMEFVIQMLWKFTDYFPTSRFLQFRMRIIQGKWESSWSLNVWVYNVEWLDVQQESLASRASASHPVPPSAPFPHFTLSWSKPIALVNLALVPSAQ